MEYMGGLQAVLCDTIPMHYFEYRRMNACAVCVCEYERMCCVCVRVWTHVLLDCGYRTRNITLECIDNRTVCNKNDGSLAKEPYKRDYILQKSV